MKTETKIKKLIKLREEILKDAKGWKGDVCPLKQFDNHKDSSIHHYSLSQLFTGLGCWKWDCPFCDEHFEE